MLDFLGSIVHKVGAMLGASLLIATSFFGPRETTYIITPQATPSGTLGIETAASSSVTLPEFQKETSTKGSTSSLTQTTSGIKVATPKIVAPSPPPPPPQKKPTAVVAIPSTTKSIASPPVAPVVPPPQVITTPEQFLNLTTSSLHQRPDGSYWIQFKTSVGITPLTWNPENAQVGGQGSIPQMNTSFFCNPSYDEVPPSIYSSFSFKVKTAYACTITLTNIKGQMSKKEVTFTTGSGIFSIAPAQAFSNRLRRELTKGGIVFGNTDDTPLTVTSLTLTIDTLALDMAKANGLRFVDSNNQVLATYMFSDLPKDPTKQYAYARHDIPIPLTLTIPPQAQKVVYLDLVELPILFVDINPLMTLRVTKVTTNRTDFKTTSLPLTLSWTCVPKFLVDDPDSMCR